MSDTTESLTALRKPFEDNQINYLPKAVSRDDKQRGKCLDNPAGRQYSVDGIYCGGFHSKSVHIPYVGHAALTNRLLDADLEWDWEPVAFDTDGLPAFDRSGGLWIRLTVGGTTRLGYGDAQGKTGPNAVKEAIGDALRNAAMRFGAALDLWSKADLHTSTQQAEAREWIIEAEAKDSVDAVRALWQEARTAGADAETLDRISEVGTKLLGGAA